MQNTSPARQMYDEALRRYQRARGTGWEKSAFRALRAAQIELQKEEAAR